jgi:hypothetical protein
VFAYEDEEKSSTDSGDSDDSDNSDDGLNVESNTLPGFLAFESILMLATCSVLRRKKTTL